jgi:isopenicillin N synthase-like dioxygenase
MNTSLNDLQTKGFVSVAYPADLKLAVAEAQKYWEAFCALPDEVKRNFPYSNSAAGVGYEDKRISGNSEDLKENFDLTSGDITWLEEQAATINNEVITSFIKAACKVAELIIPSIISFAKDVEQAFAIEGFEAEVAESKHAYFIRFIHYFPAAKEKQETAEAHTDQSGMTPHLFSSDSGLECLTQEMEWVPMPVSHGEMVIIPSMQLQLRSKGQLKATVHRVVSTPETIKNGRYSAVCFVQFKDTPKYDKSKGGRLQEAHKNELGFNYRLPHEEFSKLFKH